MIMNKEVYEVSQDRLIYDASHPLDAAVVTFHTPDGAEGCLKRGEVLDYSEGKYVKHTSEGKPGAIVAENASYAADDTDISVTVYISGTFRHAECISDVALEEKDVVELRSNGIYLK